MANSWMEAQKKRKEEERKQYKARAEAAEAEKAAREAKAQEERDAAEAEKARQAAKMAEYQDNVDFYRPGGVMRQPTNVLTREALANAQKTSSPAIDADAALQKCVKEDTKELPNAQAIELLNLRIAEARAAGVRGSLLVLRSDTPRHPSTQSATLLGESFF